jgi:hypothetical protein
MFRDALSETEKSPQLLDIAQIAARQFETASERYVSE